MFLMALENTGVMEQLEITGLYGEHDKNGGFVGVQSLRNKETYVFDYDPKTNDFVGKWIPTPDFVKRSLGIEDTSHNMHDEH